MKVAIRSPAARSSRACSSGNRTSAWRPGRKYRPESAVSRSASRSAPFPSRRFCVTIRVLHTCDGWHKICRTCRKTMESTMNVARRSLVAATALVALTLAACSSSGAGSHSSAPGSNSSSPPLKLALIGPFSGSATASSEGGLPKILDAWAQATNKAGGINGHNVQTVVMDIGPATDGGLTAVKSAITQDHVAAIVDFDTNDATWIPYAAQQSVPVIPGSAGLGSLLSDDVFPVLTSPLALSYALVAEAKTYGTKVAIGYAAEIAGASEEVTLSKTFGAGLGVNVVVASKLPSSAPASTAFCQQVKQSGATSYTLAFAAATAKKITDQCYQQGGRIPQVLIGP